MIELTKRQKSGLRDRLARINSYAAELCDELCNDKLKPGASEPRQPQVAAREYAAKIKTECDALVKACDRYMVMFFDRQSVKE